MYSATKKERTEFSIKYFSSHAASIPMFGSALMYDVISSRSNIIVAVNRSIVKSIYRTVNETRKKNQNIMSAINYFNWTTYSIK